MTTLEILLFIAWALWWMVCVITAVTKGRGLGWGVATAFFPPLFLLLLRLEPRAGGPPARARCPLCKMGWVPLDRSPRRCSGCGEEISHAVLQKELHKDMEC